MARLPVPRDYILATLKYIDDKLSQMPHCKLVIHSGHKRIRIKDPCHEYAVDSPNGKRYQRFLYERQRLTNIRKNLTDLWKMNYKDRIYTDNVSINSDVNLKVRDLSEYIDKGNNPYEKNDLLYHNGIQYRSRVEMCIAETLDQLGLEYVYEPEIMLSYKKLSPDFIIKVPAFGCCIILEYMGLLDDSNYVETAKSKLGIYMTNGYFPGTNLIILGGNKNSAPSFDSIYNSIVTALANLCTIYVRVQDRVTNEN